jgi:thiol-disulfide isomerase/thioredoxin
MLDQRAVEGKSGDQGRSATAPVRRQVYLPSVLPCSTSAAPPSAAPGSAGSGSSALDFNSRTLAGAEFTGQSLANKPAVLWFWAPWCSTCQAEAPTIGQAAAQHPNVTFVGVAALDRVPAMNQFVANYQLGGFTHLADTDTSVWRHFGITEQPAFALIAPNGSVEVVKGTMSETDLAQRLDALTQT